jgi:hypothetical protein
MRMFDHVNILRLYAKPHLTVMADWRCVKPGMSTSTSASARSVAAAISSCREPRRT